MLAHRFNIESKHRRDVGFVASLDDFTISGGVETAVSTITDNPSISLYCFDDQRRQAIFVELPPHIALANEPFVYQSQFEYAQQLFTLPLSLFNQLAKELPAIPRPIFIHITGRSGSTLLSHALNSSGLVKSLAEPDVVSQFAALRYQSDTVEEDELRELADSTMRFLFKDCHQPGILSHAVKFRNQGTLVMDIFQSACPQGKNIFLYRNIVDFVSSFQRILRNAGIPERKPFWAWRDEFQAYLAGNLRHLSRYVDSEQAELTIAQQVALWWIAVIEWYVAQHNQGIPAMSVSYTDLVANQAKTLTKLFRYCGLPSSNVTQGLQAYVKDSQSGTRMAREKPDEVNSQRLTPDELSAVQAILSNHPVLGHSDFRMPSS
ncbi:MAG: sulfotransferase [Chloroflexota bacterium]